MRTANHAEHRRWNDPYWTSVWPDREALTGAAAERLLDALSLRAGERVLDVGSGAGATTLRAAAAVGPAGRVVGADISAPLVELARRRAREAGAGNARFEVLDVQTGPVSGGPYDVVMSQFGVMFFDDPARAFANLAGALRAGGRIGFACWQSMADNPWHVGHALSGLAPPPPPPAPGASPTGPFALGERARLEALLAGAGFEAVAVESCRETVTVPRHALYDDGQLDFLGVPPERRAEAADAVEGLLAAMADGSGSYAAPLAYWVVTARAR